MHDATRESKDGARIPDVARARVGAVLKQKWRLDRLLGVGGMAVVYAATHRNGKRVAIKMLHPELARNADAKTRFLREGYLANAVGHDGVVSVLDDDVTQDGVVFLVMELLEGETVERRWERKGGRLPVVETLSIANEILDVLAAAHARGVVHRDVKPENVFLTRAGKVKILDFGIAKLRQLAGAASTTQTGATMGTPSFMAPEQARGRWDEVDARSDLWAVGAMMFALLSGRFVHDVHEAGTLNEQLLAAMTSFAPPVGSILPELPPEVASVVDRALAFSPADRWPDARAMQAGIRRAYAATQEPRAPALDPDATEAMAPLDFGAPSVLTPDQPTDQGIARAPSAAPRAGVASSRRAPIYVGLGAGVLGVLLTLAATVPRPPSSSGAAAIATASRAAEPVASAASAGPWRGASPEAHDTVPTGPERWRPGPPAAAVPAALPQGREAAPTGARGAAPASSAAEDLHAPAPEPPDRSRDSTDASPGEPGAKGGESRERLLDRRR